MGKNLFKVDILEEDLLDIERVWYELKGYENIIHTMYRSNDPRYDYTKNGIYEKMEKRYMEKYSEFTIVYNSIIEKYLDEEIMEEIKKNNLETGIEFNMSAIVIREKDKNGCNTCKGECHA